MSTGILEYWSFLSFQYSIIPVSKNIDKNVKYTLHYNHTRVAYSVRTMAKEALQVEEVNLDEVWAAQPEDTIPRSPAIVQTDVPAKAVEELSGEEREKMKKAITQTSEIFSDRPYLQPPSVAGWPWFDWYDKARRNGLLIS